MQSRTDRDVIFLASCAVNNIVPDRSRVAAMDLDEVFRLASAHMISAVVAYALESAGIVDSRTDEALGNALWRDTLFDSAWAQVRDGLEAAGIWYMPLKGAVLKKLYPKPGMREFADYDVLFDRTRTADVSELMERLGFSKSKTTTAAHDVWYRPPALNFEMHKDLPISTKYYRHQPYYENVKERLVPAGGNEYRFTPDDFYIYMIAHEYRHFSMRGTGLRSLIDTYVFLRNESVDFDYVRAEMDELELTDFEARNRSLAEHLFGSGELTGEDEEMLEKFLSAGTYGNYEISTRRQIAQEGRWRYVIGRLMPVGEGMKELYPVLRKAPFLYPVVWIQRFFRELFFHRGRFMARLKVVLEIKR